MKGPGPRPRLSALLPSPGRLLGGTLAQELLSLYVGEDRSTSPRLPEVLPGLAGFTGMPEVNDVTTAQAAGRMERTAYDAVIVRS
jgi:hypothetical protein